MDNDDYIDVFRYSTLENRLYITNTSPTYTPQKVFWTNPSNDPYTWATSEIEHRHMETTHRYLAITYTSYEIRDTRMTVKYLTEKICNSISKDMFNQKVKLIGLSVNVNNGYYPVEKSTACFGDYRAATVDSTAYKFHDEEAWDKYKCQIPSTVEAQLESKNLSTILGN